MTDDLDMGAILNHYGFEETMKRGVAAGNDLLMICHRVELAAQAGKALEGLPAGELEPALAGVAKFKARMAPPHAFSENAFFTLNSEIWDLRVATLGAERASQRPASRWLMKPSAIRERQELPVQSTSTRFMPCRRSSWCL